MKTFRSLVGAILVLVSGASFASDQWYVGATQGFFSVGDGDHWSGDIDIGQVGLQIGTYLTEDLSVEVGYSTNFKRDDFDIASLSGLIWMGDNADKYQPYLLVGTNRYSFDDEQGLPIDHYHSQLVFGVGVGSKIADDLQLRADLRMMAGQSENEDDFGFQVSINRSFGAESTAVVAPIVIAKAEPVVVAKAEPVVVKEVAKPKTKTVTILLNVEFKFDSSEVLAIYGDQLEVIAAGMREHDGIELVLEGHTDSLGSEDYNKQLSVRRAESVRMILAEDYGISLNRISTRGYGEAKPIASNETSEGRARNRRVIGEMSFTEVVSE
jgi:OOP family OmpA-OmpF porin